MQELGALAARYPSIKRPLLMAVGDKDKPAIVDGIVRLSRDLPTARLTVLKDAGHMLQFTRSNELTSLLDQLDRETASR